jgi:DNA-binding MarR family transcriptional regulator
MDKVAILSYLAHVPDAPASELASALAASLPATGMGLLRLVRSGLASRAFDVNLGVYYYAITPKGRARVQYLSSRTR